MLELAYLSLASMAGVWVRITCGVTFSTTLAVTDASGPFFTDLPANMVGCFIIGLLADGATALRLRSGGGACADDASLGCAVAALPLDSAQQRNAPLWRGLRLGLCGATTTVVLLVAAADGHDAVRRTRGGGGVRRGGGAAGGGDVLWGR